ncbi:hypothetical protein ACFFHC_06530 [Kytococcus schroeteri]|uniref:hypothetical protein n=1 Tax=Kytococcus schroeteri TaxID=138300 RepID=UPI0035EDE1BF
MCQTQIIDWDARSNYTRASKTSGTYTLPITGDATSGASNLTLSITEQLFGYMYTGTEWSSSGLGNFNENLRITDGQSDPGDVNSQGAGLQLHQAVDITDDRVNDSRGSRTDRTQTTFRFSEPVCSLSFTIRDIDAVRDDYYDEVELYSPTPYTYQNGALVTGAGRHGSPWHITDYYDYSPTRPETSVGITFSQPVQEFTVVYWNSEVDANGRNFDGDQRIFLSDMTVGIEKQVCV